MGEQSLPYQLFSDTLQRTVDKFQLKEVFAVDGGPRLSLESQVPMAQGVIGNLRLFEGDPLFRVVSISLVVPAMKLDSHMMFAFMPGNSALPHFTLDSVMAGDHFAFHLDLVPRVDIGSQLTYLREVFEPLTEAHAQGCAIEGLTAAHLSPTQLAIMSPWMLAFRASEEAFAAIEASVLSYQNHWFDVVAKGISTAALVGISEADLIARNHRNKRAIFDPSVDPVWARIQMLIGEQAVKQSRALLIGADEY
ncbi:MAG: hypothetical protein WD005_00365 [Haliea sp.]